MVDTGPRSDVSSQRFDAVRSLLALHRSAPALVAGPLGAPVEASFAQHRLWFQSQLVPGGSADHLAVAHRLTGRVDQGALERALRSVVRHHEILRSALQPSDGRLHLVVTADDAVVGALPIIDVRPDEVDGRLAELAERPFDLSRGPLFRAVLLRCSAEVHVLAMCVHHAAFDLWSYEVFMAELGQRYAEALHRVALPSAPAEVRYADYARWQRDWLTPQRAAPLRAYWAAHLAGAPASLRLGPDRAPIEPGTPRPSGAVEAELSSETAEEVRRYVRETGASLHAVLLAGFAVLLHRLSGSDDLVIGNPYANRSRHDVAHIVGPVSNMLPLRIDVSGDPSFAAAVERVGASAAGGFAHQDLPFELIVHAVNPPRQIDRPPLYSVAFALQNVPRRDWALEGCQVESWNVDPGEAPMDLVLFAIDRGPGIELRLVYDRAGFDDRFAAGLLERFELLLGSGLANPQAPISTLTTLGDAECERAWSAGLGAERSYSRDQTIAQVFADQVAAHADAVAVIAGDERLTYRGLDDAAAQVAQRLIAAGVGPGDRVGVWLGPTVWRVVGLLAIAKAGAATVAVEPSEPAAHAADLWRRADVAVVLTDEEAPVTAGAGFRWVPVVGPAPDDAGPVPPAIAVGGGAEAAVHFTSGSTGGPKGVAATHRGILARVLVAEFVSLGPGDVVAHLSPISFDPAVLEIWGALLNGATLAVIDERPPSPDRLARLIREHGVTVAFLTTALFERIVDLRPDALASLRQLLVGGEVLPVASAAAFVAHAPRCQLVNCYGPTENTIVCTWFPVDATACAAGIPLPIGLPVAASTAHVLDAAGRLVPAGVEGELHLGGDGLTLGYVNDPERSADRFVRRRPNGRDEVLLYRTGDRAYADGDGVLHFRGRTDDQVKVRGVRIAPGEVEAALAGCDGVAQVAVVVREWGSRPGRRVVAYVVAAAGADPDGVVDELQRFARQRLGSHARPSTVVVLPELPLGPTGKVDRAALPDPVARGAGGSPPRSELEQVVQDMFASVLDAAQIGLDDDFFDLGGDSLRSLDLVHRIEHRFGVTLPIASFFAEPTVAGVSALLCAESLVAESLVVDATVRSSRELPETLVAIRSGRPDRNLFLVPGGHGGRAELILYGHAFAALTVDVSIYGLMAYGLDGSDTHRTVEAMAASYLRDLRAVQPSGPYALAGECIGGAVAWEMARQLCAAGEKVSQLLLLDSSRPTRGAELCARWIYQPRQLAKDYGVVAGRIAGEIAADVRSALAPGAADRPRAGFAAARRRLRSVPDRFALVGAPYPGQSAEGERNYTRVIARYRPAPLPIPVTLVANAAYVSAGIAQGWADLTSSGLSVHTVPGDHRSYLNDEETMTVLCRLLAEVGAA